MKILGIETSCDETGAAIIEANPGDKTVKVLSNVVTSSFNLHSKTGGIIPEIAAREQVKFIIPVIDKALKEASIRHSGNSERSVEASRIPMVQRDSGQARMTSIDAIAVTVGPGLIGSLLVGVETARTLSYVWKKPIIPVNHLIGHIYANFVGTEITLNLSLRAKRSNFNGIATSPDSYRGPRNDKITFPALALIVSGGHTDLVLMRKHGRIKWLGGTRDDAAGEAFDKIGRLLGLPYPGGPSIEQSAKNGDPKAFNFPRPMLHNNDFSGEARPGSAWDFSFSGLKTAVLREILRYKDIKILSDKDIADISASVQQAIIDVLLAKTLKAAQKYKVKSILLGGGVAANQKLRDEFQLKIENFKLKIPLSVPPKHLCTDNAAMIATAAFFNYKDVPWQEIKADPELYFDDVLQ